MKKVRKDTRGRTLHKGETYRKDKKLYCFRYTDSLGKRQSIYAPDLLELRDKETALMKDKLDGIDLYARAKSDINFVFDRYISTRRDLRDTTKSCYLYTYDHYVRKSFGRRKLADVRYSDVLMHYQALMDNGLSIGTIESVHCVLHPTFQLAVRDRIIRHNPADGVMAELKKNRDPSDTGIRHALTPEQEQAFLEYIKRPKYSRWRPLLVVMLGSGCRVSEEIGLRWEDVDLEKNIITVDHSVVYLSHHEKGKKSKYEVHLPKTDAGTRTIPLLDKVKEAFLEEKIYQEETGNHCVMELDGMKGFIFFNRFGNIHNPSGINRAIKRIVDDYNAEEELKANRENREPLLLPRFSCHITRHSFCSRLCENETNIKVIQTVMGHKDIQTTLDTYAEVSEGKKQEAFRELNDKGVI